MNTRTAARITPYVDKENIAAAPTPKRSLEAAPKRAFGTNLSNMQTPSASGKAVLSTTRPTSSARKPKSVVSRKSSVKMARPKINLEDDIEYMPHHTMSESLCIPKDLDFDIGLLVRPLELPCMIPPAKASDRGIYVAEVEPELPVPSEFDSFASLLDTPFDAALDSDDYFLPEDD